MSVSFLLQMYLIKFDPVAIKINSFVLKTALFLSQKNTALQSNFAFLHCFSYLFSVVNYL